MFVEGLGVADLSAVIHSLPKIELHRHLEGSVRLETLAEVANVYQLDVPACEVEALRPYVQVMPDSPHTSEHFLAKFAVLRQFYCAPEVIQRVTREAIEDAAADNIRYLELRFTPKALARANGFAYREVVRWVAEAAQAAQKVLPIRVRLIVSMNRHEGLEVGEPCVRAALEYRDLGIAAIDLCGQEEGYPASAFYDLFQEARQAGMELLLHAGEWAAAPNVRYAIETMRVPRVGHGVRILEDPAIFDLARAASTIFEVCPTSNLHSGVVRSMAEHPLNTMRAAGLRLTLNTDDPAVSGITLSDEMLNAMQHFGLTLDDLRQMMITAAHGALLPQEERLALANEIDLAYRAATKQSNV